MCHPKAFPALETLSTTDVSKADSGWSCTELNVLDVLTEGERLTRSIASTLRYLEELP